MCFLQLADIKLFASRTLGALLSPTGTLQFILGPRCQYLAAATLSMAIMHYLPPANVRTCRFRFHEKSVCMYVWIHELTIDDADIRENFQPFHF